MASEIPKVTLSALPELKNTTDDNVAPILNSHGYTQSHILTDVRLTLGFLGTFLAALTFYQDFTLGFEAAKTFTLYAVVAYFTINSALTLWVWGVEAGTVYVGKNKEGEVVKVQTSVKKGEPVWYYKITRTGKKRSVSEGKAEFRQWFDDKGFFVRGPLEALLLKEVVEEGKKKQ